MVEVCALFCYCLLWLEDNKCMYMAHGRLRGGLWDVCCVVAVVKDSVFLALEC